MRKNVLYILALSVSLTAYAKKVKFSVDMTGQTVNTTGIHITGDFQAVAGYAGGDWQPNTTPMIQEGATDIYSVVVDIPAFHKYEFRFLNGDQSYDSEFIPEESRVLYNFNDNRWLYVDSLANDTTFAGAIPFSGNAPSGLTLLRFRVDMQNENVSANGVHLAGSFQNWNTTKTKLYSFDGQMYEYIAYIAAGTYTYKFINGNTSGQYETVPGACASSGNRSTTVSVDVMLDTVCFSACTKCALVNGIVESTLSKGVRIYPNPATDYTVVEFMEASVAHQVTVSDMTGRVVYFAEQFTGDKLVLQQKDLQKGIYFVKTQNNNSARAYTTKLVIE